MTLWLDAHQDIVAGAVALVVLILAALTVLVAAGSVFGGDDEK